MSRGVFEKNTFKSPRVQFGSVMAMKVNEGSIKIPKPFEYSRRLGWDTVQLFWTLGFWKIADLWGVWLSKLLPQLLLVTLMWKSKALATSKRYCFPLCQSFVLGCIYIRRLVNNTLILEIRHLFIVEYSFPLLDLKLCFVVKLITNHFCGKYFWLVLEFLKRRYTQVT